LLFFKFRGLFMAEYRCTVCNYVYDEEKEELLIEHNVSEIIIEQMAEWGVRFVFGIPGTSALGLVDAVKNNDKIKYFQVRHEQTAAFMASAYGKLTGHVAACLTVAGPGATNLATGLYDAKLDHAPVLALTGQVERHRIGTVPLKKLISTHFLNQHVYLIKQLCPKNKLRV
jgi:pyruvate oxidase